VVTNKVGIGLFGSMAKVKKVAKRRGRSVSPDLKKLGERIRSLRIQAGYTNYENFAFDHDIPRAQFGRYERGEDLRYSSLVKICKAFGISLKAFFSEGME
jgi:hypothetical protein